MLFSSATQLSPGPTGATTAKHASGTTIWTFTFVTGFTAALWAVAVACTSCVVLLSKFNLSRAYYTRTWGERRKSFVFSGIIKSCAKTRSCRCGRRKKKSIELMRVRGRFVWFSAVIFPTRAGTNDGRVESSSRRVRRHLVYSWCGYKQRVRKMYFQNCKPFCFLSHLETLFTRSPMQT